MRVHRGTLRVIWFVAFLLHLSATQLLSKGALAERAPGCLDCTANVVAVTPDGTTIGDQVVNTASSALFTVKNTGTVSDTYTLVCTGASGVTCGSFPSSTGPMAAGASKSIKVFFSVGGTPGTGRLTLRATGTTDVTDQGFVNVPIVAPPGPPVVTLFNAPATNVERSLCLTVGAGERGAWQCGDLQIAHSMPGYETMGRERALTLVYNSGTAYPHPRVAVRVQEGGMTVGVPDEVFVTLLIDGVAEDTATFLPWGGLTPEVRQVVLSYDAAPDTSGSKAYSVIVENRYASSMMADTVSGTLLVLNRTKSRFGSGWWLAGIEQLYLGQPNNGIMWADGDGSTKLYTPIGTPATATQWVAPLGAYRDTIFYIGASKEYVRELRHGINVVFDSLGRHKRTENRTGQKTLVNWGARDSLISIQVPAGGSVNKYLVGYVGNVFDKVTDPASRVMDVTLFNGKITAIKDPDLKTTTFAYTAWQSDRLITSRTNRRGFLTKYNYDWAGLVKQVDVQLDSAGTSYATTAFTPWNMWGMAAPGSVARTAGDTANSFSLVEGPRTGVADDAKIWVDRYGAPTRITDPLGHFTRFFRTDAAHPTLVTKLVYPGLGTTGRIDSLKYNARGNLVEMRDSTHHIDSQATAVTKWRYTSPNTEDSPDQVTDPAGIITSYAYNSWGLLSQVTAASGLVTTFEFLPSNDPRWGLVQGVVEQGVPTWDPASRTEVNKTLRTGFAINTLGNVVGDTSPSGRVDSLRRDAKQRVTDRYDAENHRTEYVYNEMNLTTDVKQYVESATLVTHYGYDADLLLSVTDPRGVLRKYEYDAAGRMTAEVDDWNRKERRFYNAAGQLEKVRARFVAGVTTKDIVHTYDEAGHKTKTTWPTRESVPGGTINFTYDDVGRLWTASDGTRKVTRTYFGNDALRTEVQLYIPDNTSSSHTYDYDAAGKRLFYRIGVTGDTTRSDSVWYQYNTKGDLSEIGVRWRKSTRDSVQFAWDKAGRRDLVTFTNGTALKYAYDDDGAMVLVCSAHSGGPTTDALKVTVYHDQMDDDGMVLETRRAMPVNQTIAGCEANAQAPAPVTFTYDKRHQMLTQTQSNATMTNTYDGSGNLTKFVETTPNSPSYLHTMLANHNQLERRTREFNGTDDLVDRYLYDANGARQFECPGTTGCDSTVDQQDLKFLRWKAYYYDGLGRMTGRREWKCDPGGCPRIGSPLMCSYDPLGRMVIPCENSPLGYDGENVVRTQADQAATGWTFVHGPGLDDPIMGQYIEAGGNPVKVYFLTDGKGRQYAVADRTGNDYSGHENYVLQGGLFAGGTANATSFGADRGVGGGITKLSFFRNRWYDQSTGRWTQEDPLGVAGGINLYQFNGNNPVAYTDPFGLCPVCAAAAAAWLIYEVGGGLYDIYNAGKTVLDPDASTAEKGVSVGLAALSVIGPGGGYSAAEKGASRVIGHFPEYTQLGERLGAKYFNVPTDVWSKMTGAEQWAANKTFLDRGIRAGADFILATPLSKIRKGSSLEREVKYLLENGYKVAGDGSKLMR